jgi:hypothetical protein
MQAQPEAPYAGVAKGGLARSAGASSEHADTHAVARVRRVIEWVFAL